MEFFYATKRPYDVFSGKKKLQQKSRVEKVIGFVLAIWGILFYSQLLSTMTEQLRVYKFLR